MEKIITTQPVDEMEKMQEKMEEMEEKDVKALSNNNVDVEIEPDVKSNNVNLHMCSCSIVFNCFSLNKHER
jgi:hypothetical protein